MGTLAFAYMAGWGFVAGYLSWLGWQQRRIACQLHELESRAAGEEKSRAKSRAA